ncbi:MAG: NAD(P)/FAD-dependent oxidoreductase [Methylococcales bacterium]|nr:NAD(P)/FAD-dependent oxidoreductase [Methylococcales bacterium]
MTLKPEASSTTVDVIVIGSGIGGLTAAALLAKSGKSVLVLEQHDRAGGYAHGFKRKHYQFDSGVHLTSGCRPEGYQGGQILYKVLHSLGLYDPQDFIPVNPFSYVEFPDLKITLPLGIDAFVDQMAQSFPDQREGLEKLLKLCLQLSEQVAIANDIMATQDSEKIHQQLALLFQYKRATLASVWGDFIDDKQLQAIFASHWPYLGLPPKKVSFIYWAIMLIGYLVDGAYYCKGGFQKLADRLVLGVQKYGGHIRYKSKVAHIKVQKNQVQNLQLTSGETFYAQTIISNADAHQTVYDMVGAEYFPKRYLARFKQMQPSTSLFVVYLVSNLDLNALGVHHEGFYYDHSDHEINYDLAFTDPEKVSWLSITVPTLIDASLAPKGEHIVVLTRMVNFDSHADWKAKKARYVENMLDYADTKIKGLKDSLLFLDAGTPETLVRYTANYKGAAYGWAATPDQIGANRLANKSPIEGLYFAGHWSTPGGGVYGACYSGVLAAQKIVNIKQQSHFWHTLKHSKSL